ncbi:MAG TPA: recombinase A [Polyangiaceae bacterium]|nr:recombinase A [Polyangiaceae bacterium]
MALPANLAQISPALAKAGVRLGSASRPDDLVLPLGIESLDAVLPDQGILRGGVVELAVSGPSGLATSLALHAVRAIQLEEKDAVSGAWCAFVDPSSTLYAPGVRALGVDLERLLVVRPPLEALGRTAVKLAESSVFSLVVIDTVGTLGRSLDVSLGAWGRIVRRLSMAVDGTRRSVLLVTDAQEQRVLPLPVAQRIELSQPSSGKLGVRVAKDRRGRITPTREIACRNVA